MNFFAPLLAHGDLGISRAEMELFELVYALCLLSGVLLLVNALLILSLRITPTSKARSAGWWVIYTLLWAAFIGGAFDRLSFDLEGRILFCMIVPLVILSHFAMLAYRKVRPRKTDARVGDDHYPPA